MPTLLQINLSANVGSHGRIAEDIGRLAISMGWRSVIAYGRMAAPSKSELVRIGNDADFYEHTIETRLFDNHGLASRRATRSFIKKIRVLNPDVIHLHNIHGYYLNYKVLFDFLSSINIPIVWTLHDCWSFTGHCGHFIMAGCERWKTGCSHCPITHTEYPKSLVDRSARNYHLKKDLFSTNRNIHIVTVSEWLAGIVKQSFFKNNDIRVISNGVDLDTFCPQIVKKNESFVILGVASKWTRFKGIDDFIKLSYLLREGESLVLIGVDDSLIKVLPETVTCVPHINSASELAHWYCRADVVLSLSKGETFGMTIIEAHACGTPTIVYNNSAQPELILNDTGFVVEDGNLKAVYDKIQQVKMLGKNHFTKACRGHAVSSFNKEERFFDYINLYKTLLND